MSDFTVTGLAARDRIEALFLTGKPEVDLLELRVGAEVVYQPWSVLPMKPRMVQA